MDDTYHETSFDNESLKTKYYLNYNLILNTSVVNSLDNYIQLSVALTKVKAVKNYMNSIGFITFF